MDLSTLPSEVQARVIKLQSCERDLFEIGQDIVNLCNTVKNLLKGPGKRSFRNVLGGSFTIEDGNAILKKEGRLLASLTHFSPTEVIIYLHEVKTATLTLVLDFCKFHCSDVPNKDKKQWNAKFVEVDQSVLCELASASYYMDIEPLVNLTSRAIASQVSGKSSDEIRETFYNANYDIYNSQLSTRYRLQKRIRSKNMQKEGNSHGNHNYLKGDDRSVEELLSFINSTGPATSQKKRRAKKKDLPQPQKQQPKPALESSTPGGDAFRGCGEQLLEPFSEEMFQEEERMIDPDFKAMVDREVEEWRAKLEQIALQYKDAQRIKVSLPSDSFMSVIGVK